MRSRLPLLAVMLTGCPSSPMGSDSANLPIDCECFFDSDGDGYGEGDVATFVGSGGCETAPTAVAVGGDCDDTDPTVFPDAADGCDHVDRNCDGRWIPMVPAGCSLAEALTAAGDGDTLLVGPGSYSGTVDFGGKAIQLIGEAGAAQTTLQGDGSGSVVRFTSGEGAGSVLQGFTISGGLADEGGGVLVQGASPTLRDLVITGNQARVRGGGLALRSSSAVVERVLLRDNRSDGEGGGLAIADCTALDLHNLSVYGNQAQRGGGLVWESSTGTLRNAFGAANHAAASGGFALLRGQGAVLQQLSLVGNSAELGGALALEGASAQVSNSALAGNTATSGPSVYATSSTLSLSFSDSFEPAEPAFVGLADPTGANGNVAQDPLFVDISAPPDGLRVRPGSPLIDAGDPGVLDADGSRSNMGAFGGPLGAGW